MTSPSIADVPASVTIGVDTHKHTHLAAAKDQLGRGGHSVVTDFLSWLEPALRFTSQFQRYAFGSVRRPQENVDDISARTLVDVEVVWEN